MHNRRGNPNEKVKDFKGAIKRLIKELQGFKYLILFALILASFGAALSITAPNKLAKLTDEISKGLVINTKNFEKVTKKTTNNLQKEIPILLKSDKYKGIQVTNEDRLLIQKNEIPKKYENILLDDIKIDNQTITSKDQIKFLKVLSTIDKNKKEIEIISFFLYNKLWRNNV